MRTIWYVSGTRADYGLMRATLRAIDRRDGLRLGILVTGMHLDPACGETVREIISDGFSIVAQIPSHEQMSDGAAMARGIGRMIAGFTAALERGRPDIVLLLGDRGEMLAAAIAAIHLDLPIAHLHGGERSGTVDEPVRHAVSKLAHLHLVATAESATRLGRMGERPDTIFVVGAPGLVGLLDAATQTRAALAAAAGLDPARRIALLVYHPVLQEAGSAGAVATAILETLRRHDVQTMALRPNSDSGSSQICAALETWVGRAGFALVTHLPRDRFVSWMAAADVMVGNSSAGIIEAATFGTPVINVGPRQNKRERNANVLDAASSADDVSRALVTALERGRFPAGNVYGDGESDSRIAALLASTPLAGLTHKSNVY